MFVPMEPAPPRTPAEEARITAMVHAHFDFLWRCLRRMGLAAHAADDAAQQVFLVASRRIADIREGAERSFLFETARRVVSDANRTVAKRRERMHDDDALDDARDQGPSPEDLVGHARALALLDLVLASLEEDLRVVLVLFEIEGMEMGQIAEMLAIPAGTVASRLRRARGEFHSAAKRMQARTHFKEQGR
jgi:RNA polymerase sigma-70 factor (ECF subfamily)